MTLTIQPVAACLSDSSHHTIMTFPRAAAEQDWSRISGFLIGSDTRETPANERVVILINM